ncbi:hypothetical protein TgHK011_000446 [Trichoderma gracile]|nr:hypothetical protein TgHK011_000446 [Trichoderma gracile]
MLLAKAVLTGEPTAPVHSDSIDEQPFGGSRAGMSKSHSWLRKSGGGSDVSLSEGPLPVQILLGVLLLLRSTGIQRTLQGDLD